MKIYKLLINTLCIFSLLTTVNLVKAQGFDEIYPYTYDSQENIYIANPYYNKLVKLIFL